MAFSFEKFLSDMMGNTDNTKKTNKKNAKTRIDKKKVVTSQNMDDGGRAALQRAKKRAAAIAIIKEDANNTKTDSTSKSKTMKGGPPAKKGTSKKKVIVTKAQLEKSGLSLRDYMNMLEGKTRINKKVVAKPKSRPSSKTMVDSFKKSNISANKNKKAGIDSAKGDNKKPKNFSKVKDSKLDSKGNYKGTNIKPTKLQAERMKKRRAKGAIT